MQDFNFKFKGKKISLKVKKLSEIGKVIGLMFSFRKNAKALLFDFKNETRMVIHSFFVWFSFYAVWLDEQDNVIEIKKVKPFRFHISSRKSYFKLIEIPCNKSYSGIIKSLVNSSAQKI